LNADVEEGEEEEETFDLILEFRAPGAMQEERPSVELPPLLDMAVAQSSPMASSATMDGRKDVNELRHEGRTLLHAFGEMLNFDNNVQAFNVFTTLLERGCDPTTKGEGGQTLLHILARKNFQYDFNRYADTLISYIPESERTAYVNALDDDGISAIYPKMRCDFWWPVRVKKLLDYDADPSVGVLAGSTVLHQLLGRRPVDSEENWLEALTTVLERGCNPTAKDKRGYTSLHALLLTASTFYLPQFMDILISFVDESERTIFINAKDPHGASAIFHAVTNSSGWCPYVINKLLDLKADPFMGCPDCCIFLHQLLSRYPTGSEEDTLRVITRLLELGYDPKIENKRGQTVLHLMVERKFMFHFDGIVDTLLSFIDQSERASYINTKDEKGKTALFQAMELEKTTLKILIPRDLFDRRRVVKKLLEVGCDPKALDERGQTALHALFINIEDSELNRFLDTLLSFIDEKERSSYINTTDSTGKSALWYMVEMGYYRKVLKLLDLDASPFMDDPTGSRMLHHLLIKAAEQCSNPESEAFQAITRLLRLGCDPKVQDEIGQTALHILTKASNKESKSEIMSEVLQHGADPLIPDNKGNLPLMYLGDADTFDATATFHLLRLMVGTGFGQSD